MLIEVYGYFLMVDENKLIIYVGFFFVEKGNKIILVVKVVVKVILKKCFSCFRWMSLKNKIGRIIIVCGFIKIVVVKIMVDV